MEIDLTESGDDLDLLGFQTEITAPHERMKRAEMEDEWGAQQEKEAKYKRGTKRIVLCTCSCLSQCYTFAQLTKPFSSSASTEDTTMLLLSLSI